MILCNWSHFGLGYIIWGVYSMGCFGPPLGRFLVALAPLWSYELDGAQKTKMLKPEWFFKNFLKRLRMSGDSENEVLREP